MAVAVGGEIHLPGLNVVLGRAAPAVKICLERLGLATGLIGDDKAGVSTLGADLHAGDSHCVAMPNNRLAAIEGGKVAFR
ncbi:hypothetical protein X772_33745 [Mesorhizobium sp. LSJC280B00]|nr:hypothetical protein X772_33745 [Mesorhizobium sp. LSJC280B00]